MEGEIRPELAELRERLARTQDEQRFSSLANIHAGNVGTGSGTPWVQERRSPGGGHNLFLSSMLALDPARPPRYVSSIFVRRHAELALRFET